MVARYSATLTGNKTTVPVQVHTQLDQKYGQTLSQLIYVNPVLTEFVMIFS